MSNFCQPTPTVADDASFSNRPALHWVNVGGERHEFPNLDDALDFAFTEAEQHLVVVGDTTGPIFSHGPTKES